ncbi:WD40/YVTN/BNR-like repeat-containing protein [Pseudomonas sp.]|uniref:WD40/YVTN/BNR-like repeat-containing protein n=1 Tax=Pseudomonas sp. TaxID=306 RepID=UPI002BE1615E|nr:YCF48-related protein [Pseudomonas sp.]HUE94227.1 YCF48-related protein [Pseudomonas sp.]
MSEPVMRRTQAGHVVGLARTPALRVHSPLAKALSLCSVLSVLMFAAVPACAQNASDAASSYSIESAQAQHSLLLDVASSGKRLVTVGDRGHILFSDDNGANWTQAKVPTKQLLTAVFFIDDQHGWAVGHDAQILASSDGGATWVKQFEDLEREAPLLDVWFKDRNSGYAVGAYGALLETTDGGANWEDVSDRMDNEDGYHLNAITEVKDSGLFSVGEQGAMFRSSDWGQTWETLEGPYEGSLFGALGTDEAGALLVYGLRGHLFRSADFGTTWEQIRLNTANNGPLEFGLSDGNRLADGSIVVVGHGGTVLKSTDNGRNFSVTNRVDRLSLAGIAAMDNGNLILVGQGGVHVASPTGADLGQQQ